MLLPPPPSRYDEISHVQFAPGGDESKRAFTYLVLTGGRFIGAAAVRLAVLKFVLSMTVGGWRVLKNTTVGGWVAGAGAGLGCVLRLCVGTGPVVRAGRSGRVRTGRDGAGRGGRLWWVQRPCPTLRALRPPAPGALQFLEAASELARHPLPPLWLLHVPADTIQQPVTQPVTQARIKTYNAECSSRSAAQATKDVLAMANLEVDIGNIQVGLFKYIQVGRLGGNFQVAGRGGRRVGSAPARIMSAVQRCGRESISQGGQSGRQPKGCWRASSGGEHFGATTAQDGSPESRLAGHCLAQFKSAHTLRPAARPYDHLTLTN